MAYLEVRDANGVTRQLRGRYDGTEFIPENESTATLAVGAEVALAAGTEVDLSAGATVALAAGSTVSVAGSITAAAAVIANGESLSAAVALGTGGARQLVGIQMPAAWTTASLTFAVSFDGTTYVPLYWDGAEYTILAAGGADASLGVSLEPSAFAGWPFVKVRSGVAATAVNQGAERTLVVLTRAV